MSTALGAGRALSDARLPELAEVATQHREYIAGELTRLGAIAHETPAVDLDRQLHRLVSAHDEYMKLLQAAGDIAVRRERSG